MNSTSWDDQVQGTFTEKNYIFSDTDKDNDSDLTKDNVFLLKSSYGIRKEFLDN